MKKVLSGILVSALIAAFLGPWQAFAGGGAVIGTDPTGGSCDGGWWDTCYGYSWQKYEVIKDISNGVMLHTTDNTGSAVSISMCEVGQTIYNYGFEVYNPSYLGYQVSTQRNKLGKQATPLPSVARGAYPGRLATIQNYTTPAGYSNASEAKNKLKEMYDYVRSHPEKRYEGIDTSMEFKDLWENVGAFCFDPDVEKAGAFKSQSNAAAKKTSTGEEKYISTGIVGTSDTKTAQTLKVNVGDVVELRFSHNLYADSYVSNSKNWNASRNFAVSLSGGSGKSSGSTAFTVKDSSTNYYIADNRPYTDGTYQYVLRDTYSTSFSTKGNYKFCESITIDSLTTTACVVVNVGNVPGPEPEQPQSLCVSTPSSYTNSGSQSGTTSVSSVVRNNSLTNNYSVYQNSVYAKPYDTVEWCHDYFPGVQAASGANVTHENEHPHDREGLWYSNTLDNHTFADYSNWKNYFNIDSHNVNNPHYSYSSGSYSAGDTTIRETSNTDNIETGQAGQTLWETITSSFPSSASADSGESHSWGCHWRCDSDICGEHCCASHCEPNTCGEGVTSCGCTTVCDAYCCNSCYVDTCYHDNDYYSNSRSGTASDTSYVYVPYNFSNWAFVSISNSLVYAGETMTIGDSTVTVETKYNNVTQDTYATQVDDAKAKLVGYLSIYNAGSAIVDHGSSDICSALSGRIKNGSCDELNSYNGMTFNPAADYDGSQDESLGFAGQTYNVYDSIAGDYYCVVVAIYPYTSGSDTNLSSSGSNTWYISAPSCRVIAKRPTFQVWGGSVFSEKDIETSSAAKNNIRSIFSYTPAGSRNTTVYGSWAEQSVVANGLVSGLASGAASGLLARAPWGGSKEGSGVNFCNYRVPLSIANFSSGNEAICNSTQKTGKAGISGAAIDPDALMDYWWVMNAGYIDKSNLNLSVDYVEAKTIRGNQVRYTESKNSGNITIGAATIPKGITHIVKSSGDIRIAGDIKYEDPGYTTEMDIPKLLIYAGGNITIDCTVGRIDAIIISEKQVKTCNNDNYNAQANSRRLFINGVVIAGSAVFNRTYGAATSINSREPAEIINYDTSVIIWGRDMADANDFETLTTVYQHELAPRY